jgi:hypothetical protein
LRALGSQIRNHLLDTELVDDPQAVLRHLQPDEAFFVLEPETLRVQIRQETATRSVVGVGHRVPHHRPLAGDLTNPGHRSFLARRKGGDYTV